VADALWDLRTTNFPAASPTQQRTSGGMAGSITGAVPAAFVADRPAGCTWTSTAGTPKTSRCPRCGGAGHPRRGGNCCGSALHEAGGSSQVAWLYLRELFPWPGGCTLGLVEGATAAVLVNAVFTDLAP